MRSGPISSPTSRRPRRPVYTANEISNYVTVVCDKISYRHSSSSHALDFRVAVATMEICSLHHCNVTPGERSRPHPASAPRSSPSLGHTTHLYTCPAFCRRRYRYSTYALSLTGPLPLRAALASECDWLGACSAAPPARLCRNSRRRSQTLATPRPASQDCVKFVCKPSAAPITTAGSSRAWLPTPMPLRDPHGRIQYGRMLIGSVQLSNPSGAIC